MRCEFLPFSPPQVGEDEINEVAEAIRSGWITTGPRVREFEERFAASVGAEASLGVSSGTDAMQVALAALGIGPGDEVITTTMTFCSTVHVIQHVGARPVLVDVERDTLNIDPARFEEAITPRTKGVLPVHLHGHPVDLDRIHSICKRKDLFVLEDAAHAMPAKYRGQTIGGSGSIAAFSFYATKNLTTAEGGMLTGSQSFIEKTRPWTIHGISKDAHSRYSSAGSWSYDVVLPGFKCNMTDIQAAMGLVQLKKLPGFQERRRVVVDRYTRAFESIDELEVPIERSPVRSAWHIFALRLRLERLAISRDRFIEELRARNIGTSVHFIPVHLHPFYRESYGYAPEDFPVAYSEFKRLVSLPLHPGLSDRDIDDVIDAVTDVVKKFRR